MKIAAYQNEPTIIIGGAKEMKFSIEENGVIFDILRDKMYSNKIGSIVREVASNSRDANRENGNADIPVTIMITKQYSQTLQDQYCIVFRDSGLGISPDRMANVFVKYAASTKRNTNAQTGGFGLGAKTPFAYTDSFYIHTTADYAEPIIELYDHTLEDGTIVKKERVVGHKPIERRSYFYNALVDDSGSGKMILLVDEPSDAPTGTDIILPLVQASDKNKFADEIVYYTSLWGGSIILEGVNEHTSNHLDPDKIIVDDELVTIIENEYWDPYQHGVYCLVDGIPYPIDQRISERVSDLHNELDSHTIFLKFNTGEVSVTATREGIEYNELTKKAIDLAFGKLLKVMVKRFSKQINQMPYVECVKGVVSTFASQQNLFQNKFFEQTLEGKVVVVMNKYVKEIDILKEVSYKGETLGAILEKYGNGGTLNIKKEFEVIRIDKKEPEKYNVLNNANILKMANHPLYLLDSNKDRRRNLTIFDNTDKQSFFLIRPFGRKAEDALSSKQCDVFLDMVFTFDMEMEYYSEVEKKAIDPGVFVPGVYIPGETVSTRWRQLTSGTRRDGGSPFVVEVDRKAFTYSEFKPEKHYVFTVDKLSDISANSEFVELADELKYKMYITTQRTHDLYFKDEPYMELKEASSLIPELKGKRLEVLCEGLDMELLRKGVTATGNMYRSTNEHSIYYNDSYHQITLANLMVLGFYSERINTLCKILLDVEPTFELVEFMIRNRNDISRLSSYKKELGIELKPKVSSYRKRDKVKEIMKSLIQRTFQESMLIEGTIGSGNDVTLKNLPRLVEELLILKSI